MARLWEEAILLGFGDGITLKDLKPPLKFIPLFTFCHDAITQFALLEEDILSAPEEEPPLQSQPVTHSACLKTNRQQLNEYYSIFLSLLLFQDLFIYSAFNYMSQCLVFCSCCLKVDRGVFPCEVLSNGIKAD